MRKRYAVRSVFFCCASIVSMCKDALRQICSIVLLFPLLLRNALCGCAVGNVLFYRIEISVLRLSQRTTPLQQPSAPYRMPPSYCISALRQQQRKEKYHKTSLPQCIPCTSEQSTHNKKRAPYRTHPKHCTSAGAVGGATQCHFRTNLHTRNITPRTSAKRGQ